MLVNKFSPVNQTELADPQAPQQRAGGEPEFKPTKLTYKGTTASIVDKVLITSNEHEHQIIKVLMRQVRLLPC